MKLRYETYSVVFLGFVGSLAWMVKQLRADFRETDFESERWNSKLLAATGSQTQHARPGTYKYQKISQYFPHLCLVHLIHPSNT